MSVVLAMSKTITLHLEIIITMVLTRACARGAVDIILLKMPFLEVGAWRY